MICGKLHPSGELTDMQNVDVPRTWQDGATDVPLAAIPSGFGPFTYDAQTQTAVPSASLDNLDQRAIALAMIADLKAENKLIRAALLTMGDEINILRGVFRDLETNTANNAATVAGIRAAIAAIPALPDRTKAQAIAALKNKLHSGNADNAE